MPPPIALALILLLIGYLLRRDIRQEPRVSLAIWIPMLWLMINGSRQVSQWLEGGPAAQFSVQALSDGNPIDRAVYFALMLAGLCVLARRRVQVGEILKNNNAIALFLLYTVLSVVWSDEPLTALKRWVKAAGDPIMVLVLWSDPAPVRAVVAALKRCAYVLIPLSGLFCKYYVELGRNFDSWGRMSYTGVTLDKNMFGYLLFAFGLLFAASLLSGRGSTDGEGRPNRTDRITCLLMLAMIGWLVPIANSKTATVALLLGIAVILAVQFETVRRHFWSLAIPAVVLIVVFEELFSVKSAILEASDRDATFTGRTGLWETVLREPINPLLGEGYGSFWLGERLERFWAMYPTSPPIQAHNGYIEVYLNLGLVGVLLIAGVLLAGLRTMQRRATATVSEPASATHDERTLATFGLGYGIAYLFYNITEATFQGLNPLFTIFLTLAFVHRGITQTSTVQLDSTVPADAGERAASHQPAQPRGVG
jgi:exopolysaccharide production protein ExoQ